MSYTNITELQLGSLVQPVYKKGKKSPEEKKLEKTQKKGRKLISKIREDGYKKERAK